MFMRRKSFLRRSCVLSFIVTLLFHGIIHAGVKHVIVLISDGWGYNQIAATRYWTGIAREYESWDVVYPMSTYMWLGNYDTNQAWSDFNYVLSRYTDSAAAATAMSTGVKTYQGAICFDSRMQPLENLIERAEMLGLATGVITSVEWSHATPAGFVAHNRSRNNYDQIAREMVYESAVDVIMGAGHPMYGNEGEPVPSPQSGGINYGYVGGEATWDELVAGTAGGDADGDGIDDPWTLIQTREEFQALAHGDTPDRVLGTAQTRLTLQQARPGGPGRNDPQPPYTEAFISTVPTLEEMTRAALNVLDNDPDGFFLMIEGGAVDWANHANQLGRMIEEQVDFDNAFEVVIEWVEANSDWEETLVIVTGDHECGYLWGPNSGSPATFNPIVDNGTGVMPGYRYYSGYHTNSLIPLFAQGFGSERFEAYAINDDIQRGPYIDNTNIAHVIFGLYDESAVVYTSQSCAAPGSITTVFVNVDNQTRIEVPIDSVSIELGFDEDLLTPIEVEATARTINFSEFGWDVPNPGLLTLRISGNRIECGVGPVAEVQFAVDDEAPSGESTQLFFREVDFMSAQDGELLVLSEDGTIFFGEFGRGDVSSDCAVDILDVLGVVNIILGVGDPPTEDQLWAGDCNGDGNVDVLDALGIVNVILGSGQCEPGAGRSGITPEVIAFLNSLKPYLPVEDFVRFMALVKEVQMPIEYRLNQNYPNPFNPATTIHYTLPDAGHRTQDAGQEISLKIYNILGQEVRTLVNGIQNPGSCEVSWDGRDALGKSAPSGVYFYRLSTGEFTATKRMVLMK
ncbi:MAG: alkaline phosphatase [Gemmatimonadota bacterium]|nr:MAG: alkaline phosphatase [Gemmatimonadota bacterium]